MRKHEAARDRKQTVLPSEITVAQWLNDWVNNVMQFTRAATTIYAYRNIITNHIAPALGDVPLQKLTPHMLQQYYTALICKEGLSTNTARKHHDLLNASLKFAVKQEVLLSNPAERIEAPKVKRPIIHYYTMEELNRLFDLSTGTRLELLIKLAGYLGLRREEILGLTWDHVNLEDKIIEIQTVRTAAGKQEVIKEPKTSTSWRTLHIPEELKEALLRGQRRQQQYRAQLGDTYHQSNYVVTYEDGLPMRPNYASELFVRFIQDNKLPPLTLHGLRHSFASIASAKGIPLYDIGRALGHSSTATTSRVYTHLLDPDHRALMDTLWDSESKK